MPRTLASRPATAATHLSDTAMPAAASFEDIYKTSSSSSSSASPAADHHYHNHHLPDYMAMYMDNGRSRPASEAGAADDELLLLSTSCPTSAHTGAKQTSDQLRRAAATPTASLKESSHPSPRDSLLNHKSTNNNNKQLKTYLRQQQQQQVATTCDGGSQLGQLRRQQLLGRRHSGNQSNLQCAQDSYFNDYDHNYYGFEADDEMVYYEHDSELIPNGGSSRCGALNKHTTYNNLNSMITFDDDHNQQLLCINHSKNHSSFLSTTMTPPTHQHYLTLEELKMAHSSCWLCGCNWQQDHVSLDCQECGGYALTRPCPNCDGKCKQVWKRNITGTHDHHRASWVGQCKQQQQQLSRGPLTTQSVASLASATVASSAPTAIASKQQEEQQQQQTTTASSLIVPTTLNTNNGPSHKPSLASSCCSSQPSSATSSDCESDCAGSSPSLSCKDANPQLLR